MSELVAIALVSRPRGIRGEVVAEILTDFPERFEGLRDVMAVLQGGEQQGLKIENFWFQKGRIVLKFADVDSIEEAEMLRGAEICVDENDAVSLEENEYFDWELEGCAVESVEGEKLGKVREVLRTGGAEVLVIDGNEKELMIPFAESICVEVDIEKKLIRVEVPEGLLEL